MISVKIAGKLPEVGNDVQVVINDIGPGECVGHFVEHGYVGAVIKLNSPPDWWVSQNGEKETAHVFPNEMAFEGWQPKWYGKKS